jgi:hypothetical protein
LHSIQRKFNQKLINFDEITKTPRFRFLKRGGENLEKKLKFIQFRVFGNRVAQQHTNTEKSYSYGDPLFVVVKPKTKYRPG